MAAPIEDEAKEFAHRLYLEKTPIVDIAKAVRKKFRISCKASTVYRWVDEKGWRDEKRSIQLQATEQLQTRRTLEVVGNTAKQLGTYEKMHELGRTWLEETAPESALDAARIADMGIQGERRIGSGIISLKFVQDVLGVLVEEITDETTIRRVAGRLRRLVADLSEASLAKDAPEVSS